MTSTPVTGRGAEDLQSSQLTAMGYMDLSSNSRILGDAVQSRPGLFGAVEKMCSISQLFSTSRKMIIFLFLVKMSKTCLIYQHWHQFLIKTRLLPHLFNEYVVGSTH